MLLEPRSGRMVAWGNAWLGGTTSLDEAADGVCRGELHRVDGLAGLPGGEAVTVALGRLRQAGAGRLRLALPAAGDPLGLSGPAPLTEAALEAGEAVVVVGAGLALVPAAVLPPEGVLTTAPAVVTWQVHPADDRPPDLPSLREAEQELTRRMAEAAQTLAGLDVAGADAETLELLAEIRRCGGRRDDLAPGYPPAARRVLALARRLAATVEVARRDPGAALSATTMRARDEALRPLEQAARRARVAAYNAPLEPSGSATDR